MSVPERLTAQRRLAILQVLLEESDFSSNENNLETILRHLGHKPTFAQLRTCLTSLRDANLIDVQKVGRPDGSELWLSKITELGQRVAKGWERSEGVARPGEV